MKTDEINSHLRGIGIAVIALVIVIGLLHLPGSIFDRHEWMSDVIAADGLHLAQIPSEYRTVPIELKIGDVTWEIDYCVRHGEALVTRKELKR